MLNRFVRKQTAFSPAAFSGAPACILYASITLQPARPFIGHHILLAP